MSTSKLWTVCDTCSRRAGGAVHHEQAPAQAPEVTSGRAHAGMQSGRMGSFCCTQLKDSHAWCLRVRELRAVAPPGGGRPEDQVAKHVARRADAHGEPGAGARSAPARPARLRRSLLPLRQR